MDEPVIRPLEERDLDAAHRIMRLAFGKLHGAADPESFMVDADLVRTRWRANPAASFVAEVDGAVAGSISATNWGTVGFPGPLSVHPDLWDRGIGKRLFTRAMRCFARWETRHVVFFTYPGSTRHVGWYQTLGFWPRFLIAVMEKPVEPGRPPVEVRTLSDLADRDRPAALAACREVTDTVYDGLDMRDEIRAVASQQLGDTVLLWGADRLDAFAVCHYGPGTEGGSGTCFVKCAAVRCCASAAASFERLLVHCEALAATRGVSRLVAGVNTARRNAYEHLLASGFQIELLGVSMHTDGHDIYNRRDVYALDDWR